MTNMDSIEDELENCFINISETNTEDEFNKKRINNLEVESDSSLINSDRHQNNLQNNSHYNGSSNNPNLIFKKDNNLDSSLNSKNKNKNIINTGNILRNQIRTSSKNKNINTNSSSNLNNKNNLNSINKIDNVITKLKNENYDLKTSLQNELDLINKKLTETQKALRQIRQDKLYLEDENGILKLEKEKIGSIKDTQILTLNEKIMKFEIENVKLKEMNDFSKNRLEEYTPKIYKYEEIYEKYTKLLNDNERLNETNNNFNNVLQIIKKEKEEISSKLEIMRLENEALKNDKYYLSKENMTINEKLSSNIEKIKNLEEEMRDVRKTNQNYLDKLTEKNMNIGNSFEEKLRIELEEMKKKYENDKENMKKLFEELSDKRCQYLSEEKEECKHKLNKNERIIKEKEEMIEFLNTEIRNYRRKTDEDLSFLRVQNKIKLEELERISNMYEENMNLIKILKNENDSLKDKHDVIRTEMIKKEADYRTEISELKSQLSMLKEKIGNYDQIENELDKVILDSAYLMNDDGKSNEVLGIIKDIPTTSKRRISQCLILANKLKLMTVELEKLKDMNKRLENDFNIISEEKDIFKKVAEKSKQPHSYLVKNLQDLELELHKKNYNLEEKDQSIRSLLRENEMLNEKIQAVEIDMKTILGNRKKLDSLEDIISKFIQNDDIKENEAHTNYINENKFSTGTFPTSPNFYSSNNNSISTKYNTKIMSQNMMSPVNNMMSPANNANNNNYMEFPERDTSNTNYNKSGINLSLSMPKWYQNLKLKDKMK